MAEQLTFDWPNGVALGADDFFVSDANAQAYAQVLAPDSWPEAKLALIGPVGCGKTHLARILIGQSGGSAYHSFDLPDLPGQQATIVIHDMQALPQNAQEQMFHLHNHMRNTGGRLLMTATAPPSRWPITLPDLASRMQATTIATIREPDDALLQALFMKLFADRQINPAPELIGYLATRCERSFDAVAELVDRLDRTAMEESRPITRALARRLLDNTPQNR